MCTRTRKRKNIMHTTRTHTHTQKKSTHTHTHTHAHAHTHTHAQAHVTHTCTKCTHVSLEAQRLGDRDRDTHREDTEKHTHTGVHIHTHLHIYRYVYTWGRHHWQKTYSSEHMRTQTHTDTQHTSAYSRNPAIRSGHKVARFSKTKEKPRKPKKNNRKSIQNLRSPGTLEAYCVILSVCLDCMHVRTRRKIRASKVRIAPRRCPTVAAPDHVRSGTWEPTVLYPSWAEAA